jgi:hypothetical protein
MFPWSKLILFLVMPFGFTAWPSHKRQTPDNKIAFDVSPTVSENVV